MEPPAVLLSIHDVTPSTLPQVEELVELLCRKHLLPATLLIVPGHYWQPGQLDRLRQWVRQGFDLAGHGWAHKVSSKRGLYHRLHSWLISADAAEHLTLDQAEIENLLTRNHVWFTDHGLPAPDLYVPPAWAWGIAPSRLPAVRSFVMLETLRGIYIRSTQRHIRLPLVGFEADTSWRAAALRAWNSAQIRTASERRPLRLTIHPHDLRYLLVEDLKDWLDCGPECLRYHCLLSNWD